MVVRKRLMFHGQLRYGQTMENKSDPKQRDLLYEQLPAWIVDYVLSPYSDEVGHLRVFAKWAFVGIAIAVTSFMALTDAAFEALAAGMACAVLALLFMERILRR